MSNGVEKKNESKPRTPVTQKLCDTAKYLIEECGCTHSEVANMVDVNPSTISKIKKADYKVEKYHVNCKESNEKYPSKRKKAAEAPEVVDYTMAPVPGQIEMDLDAATPEKKPEMSDTTKMMRFFASQVEKLAEALNGIATELKKMTGGAEA